MNKVFIDGGHGTTGLRINEYLSKRGDISILELPPEYRKDVDARLSMIKQADVSILCLPDQAAGEIAGRAPQDSVLIDTSSRHRTAEGWVYGMPELTAGQRDRIKASARISNPGCHASGFILLVRPLVEAGYIDRDALLSCFCITGYSGGGKSMIASYESPNRAKGLSTPAQYALGQGHKHLPEMARMAGLSAAPCFSPVVADFFSGMVMTVQLHRAQLGKAAGADELREVLAERYSGERLIHVAESAPEGSMYSDPMSGRDDMKIYTAGNDERILLIAVYDNLGKGACGAAVQNLNIVLGTEETLGLEAAF